MELSDQTEAATHDAMTDTPRPGKYDHLTREQLAWLLAKRDRQRRLGLVWERDELEADRALDGDFVATTPIPGLHEGADPWGNLVIEGDNYDALRWLRMTWAGRIKCIYVDPPYNTGRRDWVYNDHYMSPSDRYKHSTWLEYLYRRFVLARDLLTDDGVILISINDENRARLELLLDEALPGMRIGSFAWRTRVGGNEGGSAFLSDNHEHVLIYGNKGFRFGGTEKSFELYSNPNGDPRGDWKPGGDLTVPVGHADRRAGAGYYPLYDPRNHVWYPCNPDAVWRYASRQRSGPNARIKTKFMEDWIATDQIAFPESPRVVRYDTMDELYLAIRERRVPTNKAGNALIREGLPDLDFWVGKPIAFGTPSFKRFKKDVKSLTQPVSSWIVPRSELETKAAESENLVAGTNDEGTKVVKAIFGSKAFDYAKPPSLLRGLLEQAAGPDDVVLDFFAGSATTAHAVMLLNGQDGGDRRFIMVSSTEATEKDPHKNLCRDVTAQRIRILNKSQALSRTGVSAGFAYLRCRKLSFADIDYENGLAPDEAWAALQAVHQLPLKAYEPGAWNANEADDVAIVYVDRFADDLVTWVEQRVAARKHVTVYAWAPGQIRERLTGAEVEVSSVHDVLVSRFRQ